MSTESAGGWEEVVAAADLGPVVQSLTAELVHLRQQISETRQTLDERERLLAEARQGRAGSAHAAAALNGVLTDMVLKGRLELQAAQEEAKRTMKARLAAAEADADVLVSDAAAALAATLNRSSPFGSSDAPSTQHAGPAPVEARPPTAAPGPAGTSSGTESARPPEALSTPAAPPPPPPAPAPPPWPPTDSRRDVQSRSVQVVEYDLDEQFTRIVGLKPNTAFRTPPHGTPAVAAPAKNVTAAPDNVTRPPDSPAPAMSVPGPGAQDAFDAFWPNTAALPRSPVRRHQFSLIDALLPIIALTLIVVVVLSWAA